jgi:hypothetical protein
MAQAMSARRPVAKQCRLDSDSCLHLDLSRGGSAGLLYDLVNHVKVVIHFGRTNDRTRGEGRNLTMAA